MVKPKPLYMAKSLTDLNAFADSKVKITSAKVGVSSYEKILLAAKDADIDGDEERAYVLYMRALSIYHLIRKLPEYEKQKTYYNAILSPKKIIEITGFAEKLSKSLNDRYDEILAEALAKKIEERETDKSSEPFKPAVPNANVKTENDALTAEKLYNIIKKDPDKTLILDVRPLVEFNATHMKHESMIHIDSEKLKPSFTVSDIELLVPQDKLSIWKARRAMDHVIIIDWCTKEDVDLSVSHPMQILKDAIYKWDANSVLRVEPLIFKGGIKSLIAYYPSLVTDPTFTLSVEPKLSNDLDFSYPDLNDARRKQDAEIKRLQDLEKKRLLEQQESDSRIVKESSSYVSPSSKFDSTESIKESTLPDSTVTPSVLGSELPVSSLPVVDRSSKPSKTLGNLVPPVNPFLTDPKNSEASSVPSSSVSITQSPVSPAASVGKVTVANVPPLPVVDRSRKPDALSNAGPPLPSESDSENSTVLKDQRLVIGDVKNNTLESIRQSTANDVADLLRTKRRLENDINSIEAPARLTSISKTGASHSPASVSSPGGKEWSGLHSGQKLPPGWERVFHSDTGRFIFIDHNTKVTHWHLPEEVLESFKQQRNGNSSGESPKSAESSSSDVCLATNVASKNAASGSRPTLTEKLKDEPVTTLPRSSKLKRSGSQPNLANLDDSSSSGVVHRAIPVSSNALKDNFSSFDAQTLRRLSPEYGLVNRGVTGLRNLGNTCYMNSIIQALNNTPVLVDYFLNRNYARDINKNNPLGHRGEIAEQFAVVIFALWSGKYVAISPSDFKFTLGRHAEAFSGNEQQDSQEFLLFLMDGLHEDLNQVKARKLPRPVANEEQLPDGQRAAIAWDRHKSINKSIIVQLFQGQFKSTLMCLTCRYTSITFDAFMYLSLPIPSTSRCSLLECVGLFLREERLSGSSQWFCPKCKQDRDAVKKIDIWKFPPYLLIHLKRFSCDRGSAIHSQKLNTFVDFPLKNLDLSSCVRSNPSAKCSPFQLYAVSNHFGNMESGHYTAFCENPELKKWFKFDDDFVSEVRPNDVRTASAYILFYSSLGGRFKVSNL